MKFLSKKLVLATVLAMVGVGGISANPAKALFDANQANFSSDFYKQKVAYIKGKIAKVDLSNEDQVGQLFTRIYYDFTKASAQQNPELSIETKIACLMKSLEENLVKYLNDAFLSQKLIPTPNIMEIVITRGFVGGSIAGGLRQLTEDRSLQAIITAWGEFHASSFARFFDPAKKAEVDAEIKAFKVKAGASMFNPLNWFKTAPKTAAPAVPAPVEVVEPAVVLDTVWFDDAINGANVLVSSKTVTEETRKKALDNNLLGALNAWIANPANVTAGMVEALNTVAVKTSPAVVEYLKSLEIIIKLPVVDGINTLDAYKAYARAQWKKGNAELDRAFVLITKIELNAELAAK
ncbi:MAG: hypothetical protein WCS92_03095 [Candidatus Babeliales bacterium]|jgi:hypothetical protein